jgi:hypothetical protein
MMIHNYILSKDCIHSLKTTNQAEDIGKQFLISDAVGILEAQTFVDTVLKQLYKSGSIPPKMIHPNFNPPR